MCPVECIACMQHGTRTVLLIFCRREAWQGLDTGKTVRQGICVRHAAPAQPSVNSVLQAIRMITLAGFIKVMGSNLFDFGVNLHNKKVYKQRYCTF